jgi:hypothetical protein
MKIVEYFKIVEIVIAQLIGLIEDERWVWKEKNIEKLQ